MTKVQELAQFVAASEFSQLSAAAVETLKIRILDSLACALGGRGDEVPGRLRRHVDSLGGSPQASLIGGGKTAADRAAFHNGALVRYLDFNDSYLAKGETCHPSDNLGAVLATAEMADRDGRELLTALAVAYQVQCRLSDEAPVRVHGFDHTTQGSYAAAAGASRAIGLDAKTTAHAIAISGTALNALRVTRTGALSHWKGLAYPHTGFGATHAVLLARAGITGPEEVFEGNKGFMDSIAGRFELNWEEEDLERVRHTIIKKYNAEIHSQSAIEAALELQAKHGFHAEDIRQIEIEIFEVAFHIIGGGEEGDKSIVRRKEEADHSLQYMLAVALLDGDVMPQQYEQSRIEADDVQSLLRNVTVRPDPGYSERFPQEMPCRLLVRLRNGQVLETEKDDYEGFFSRPVDWEGCQRKFWRLAGPSLPEPLGREIVSIVGSLESTETKELTAALRRVPLVEEGE